MTASAAARLAEAFARIEDPAGEGARAFLTLYRGTAAAEAAAADARARAGLSLGPLDGAIVSVKDLYDVKGEPTRSGSKVHAGRPPARADAPIVRRLRAAGAVIVGKTNMTEFAFSGIGINPHYGTPGNPFDRARIPGGSSSGAVVSVADGMAEIAIGSDTGGSTRLPAGFCGMVGFKPTQRRIPRDGAFALSPTLDTVGPIAPAVRACALADAVMAGEEPAEPIAAPIAGLRLAVIRGLPLENLDAKVGADFQAALEKLAKAGARIVEVDAPLIETGRGVVARASFAAIEANAALADDIAANGDAFDTIVRRRVTAARDFPAAEYIRMLQRRAALQRDWDAYAEPFDAFVLPTIAIVAPRIADLDDFDAFMATNLLVLRNTQIANFFDLPSISLPMQAPGTAPTGFMLFGRRMEDHRLFAMAAAIEPMLRG